MDSLVNEAHQVPAVVVLQNNTLNTITMQDLDLKPIADQISKDLVPAVKKFVDTVQKMRIAQKRYFELMARAKKSKHPDDFNNARTMLTMSKELEKQVDVTIDQFNQPIPPAPPADRIRQEGFTSNVPPFQL
jgi:hypothetical protein